MIRTLKDKSCEERLKNIKLATIETRRLRGDLIEVFKIFKGFDNIEPTKFLELINNVHTRGHSLKMFKQGCGLDCRKYAFSQRVVNIWNSLDKEIIACDSTNSFKHRIDKFLKGIGFI